MNRKSEAGTAPVRRSPWLKAKGRERERLQKRDAVLHAAVQSFNERGFHATSLDDVAVSLNVTKPTIYHYFASKDDILFECVRLGLEEIRQAAAAVEANGGSGLAMLRALMRDYAIVMTQDFGRCVIRTLDHELSPESRAKFRALKREIDDVVRRVVESGMQDGSIMPGDARLLTFTLTGALNWIGRWYDPAGTMTADEVADGTVGILVRCLPPQTAVG